MNHPASPVADQSVDIVLAPILDRWDCKWDELAGSCPQSGVMQSSAWMRFKRLEGYEAYRVGFFRSEVLIGGATLFDYPYAGQGGFIICPEGPVLPWNDVETSRTCLRLLEKYAQEVADRSGDIGLRIEPQLCPPAPSLLRNWSVAPVVLTPEQTLFLDLTLSHDEILAQMKPKGRYNLKLAIRHGVTVRKSRNIYDVTEFYRLFSETATRNNFFAEPFGFFLNLGASFFGSGQAELYFADYQGQTLGSILVTTFGIRATYLYGGSTSVHREVMPNYLLQWEAIKSTKEAGCIEYDFFGYDPFGTSDHLYAGISRFKKQFGGRSVETIGARDRVFYDNLAAMVAKQMKNA